MPIISYVILSPPIDPKLAKSPKRCHFNKMPANAWKLKTRTLEWQERPLLMGVLNVTPDSFSDGGRYLDPEQALDRALEMEAEGATEGFSRSVGTFSFR